MNIDNWLGLGTFFVLIAGASFAFVNKYILNPDHQYIDIRCCFNRFAIDQDKDLTIKVEKINGKVSQVFCPCNTKQKCSGRDKGNNHFQPPEKCWIYEN